MEFKPGALVHVRDRDWVVLPSTDDDLVLLKPLDGSEEDITGIYRPLDFEEDFLESAEFPYPGVPDMGDFASARLLYNAARLSIRNVSGPFRSMGKLSFRTRAYQMVPLIMALRQNNPVRLLIADDVGVGKTIEALIVLKELLERGEISRFAVIVLPHLCEQWQAELKDKFNIDAVVIRSNTQTRLDREIPGDTGVFQYYPFQVISIDYIKSPQRRQMFIQDCPELQLVPGKNGYLKEVIKKAEEEFKMEYIPLWERDAERRGEIKGMKKQAKETAKNLLKMGLDIEKVSEATGLKKKEIEKLKETPQGH